MQPAVAAADNVLPSLPTWKPRPLLTLPTRKPEPPLLLLMQTTAKDMPEAPSASAATPSHGVPRLPDSEIGPWPPLAHLASVASVANIDTEAAVTAAAADDDNDMEAEAAAMGDDMRRRPPSQLPW